VVVGRATWDLHLPGCQSLKDKRRVLRSLTDRLRHRFNVSVAETGLQDRWQRAEVSCCVISTEQRHAASVLSSVDAVVEGVPDARIIDSNTCYL